MRRRPLVLLALVPVLAGALVLSLQGGAANSTGGSEPAIASLPHCADSAVTYRLTTNSPVYLPGQPVRVSLEVRNAGARWCRVIGQCNEVATLAIFDGGRMVWSDRPCFNADWDAVPIALGPHRLLTAGGAWTTRGVRPGWYEARGAFLKVTFLVL